MQHMWIPRALTGNGLGPMGGGKKQDETLILADPLADPRPTPRRERQTIVPAFDPATLAKELEAADDRPTLSPPFDPSSYARIVDDHVGRTAGGHETPRTITAVTPVLSALPAATGDDGMGGEATTTIGRAMYGSYLQSDYPEALVLAERVLEREPEHALARLVADGCRDRLTPGSSSETPRLVPSSVVRLRRPAHELASMVGLKSDITSQIVIGHVDGVSDVAMLADLVGIPRPEALDRLHALLELGLLEVVNG